MAELPTVDQIIEKYVWAIGGKQAVQAQTSRVMRGTITSPSVGGKGTIEIYAKAPNKQLTEISLNLLGNSRTGFNGTVAWEEEKGEVKEAPGFSKRDADFYLPIKLKDLYPRIDLKGTEKIGLHVEIPTFGISAARSFQQICFAGQYRDVWPAGESGRSSLWLRPPAGVPVWRAAQFLRRRGRLGLACRTC